MNPWGGKIEEREFPCMHPPSPAGTVGHLDVCFLLALYPLSCSSPAVTHDMSLLRKVDEVRIFHHNKARIFERECGLCCFPFICHQVALFLWCRRGASQLPKCDGGGSGYVERINLVRHRDAHYIVRCSNGFCRETVALRAHDNGQEWDGF